MTTFLTSKSSFSGVGVTSLFGRISVLVVAALVFGGGPAFAAYPPYDYGECQPESGANTCTTTSADGIKTTCGPAALAWEKSCKTTYPDGVVCSIVYDGISGHKEGCTKNGQVVQEGSFLPDVTPERALQPIVNAATNAATFAVRVIAFFMLGFGNFMLGIAGTLFNWVILVTVYQFATYFGNSAGVLLAWGILRDMANIVLLFGFIFIGLQTILDINNFSVKKTLPRLLIFAVLLNFSLFVTEAIIDTTNVFSAVLSTQAGTGCSPDTRGIKECVNYGIAGAIMKGSGLSAMFDPNINQDMYQDDIKAATIFLGAALFSIIGAFVLGAAAIMLLIRAVTLTFLMVLSPLGFAALAIPGLEKIGKDWWKTMMNQATFAPVLILLMLVSLKISEGFKTEGTEGPSLIAGLAAQNTSALGVMVIFTLVIGFLLASIIVAKKMGAIGADFATATAGGVMAGTAGFIGRRTVGFASAGVAKAIRGSKFGRSNTGRMFATGLDKAAGSTFDARGVIAKLPGAKGIKLGEVPKGAKDGYSGIRKHAKEARVKYAATLTQTKEEKEAEAAAEASQKEAKGVLSSAEAARDAATAPLIARQREIRGENEAELKPLRDDLRAKKEQIDTAAASGDVKTAEALELSYNNDLRAFEVREKALQRRVDEIQEERDKIGERYATVAKAANSQTATATAAAKEAKEAPQRGYAADLEKARVLSYLSAGGYADKEGAKEIIKELKKSKTDKQLEKIEKAIEKAGGEEKKALHEVKETVEKKSDHDGSHGAPTGDAHGPDEHH